MPVRVGVRVRGRLRIKLRGFRVGVLRFRVVRVKVRVKVNKF